MRKEEKDQLIESLAGKLANTNILYITDISELDSENTTRLRALCFRRNVKLTVVKNTLLRKAMEKTEKNFSGLFPILNGPTSVMIAESGNIPAKVIKEFRKSSPKPILKGAYIEEMIFVGDDQLDFLAAIKSKNELIGDVIGLLQSPARNVIMALQGSGHKLSGIVKTLSEKAS